MSDRRRMMGGDIFNGHEYVDLGLPSGTLWAKCNVGASSEEDYGNYYAWGHGAEQWSTSTVNYGGTENPLDVSVDTARCVMGGLWRMPTYEQLVELSSNTTRKNSAISNVLGLKFINKSDNTKYIFIPYAGYKTSNYPNGISIGDRFDILSSTCSGSPGGMYYMRNTGSLGTGRNGWMKGYGYTIRGVITPE